MVMFQFLKQFDFSQGCPIDTVPSLFSRPQLYLKGFEQDFIFKTLQEIEIKYLFHSNNFVVILSIFRFIYRGKLHGKI